MVIAAWIALGLEVILLLVWVYSVFFSSNRTDPAGQGTALFFLILLLVYISAGVLFMLLQRSWSVITVLIMAAIPLTIVGIGLWKAYGPNGSERKDY